MAMNAVPSESELCSPKLCLLPWELWERLAMAAHCDESIRSTFHYVIIVALTSSRECI